MQSTKTSTSYHCNDGSIVKLGRLLGSGGEGDVFECQGNACIVAKIYHKQPHLEHSRKLSAMAQICSKEIERIAAWPSHTLSLKHGGAPIGFLMRRFGGEFREIVSLYNPMDRKKLFPKADFSFLAHTAVNLAAAFDTMHSAGIVVGDVNQKNILVNHDALIRLIDCDSFQITHNNERFRCRVGVPDYTPPELQGKTFEQIDRCANHDNFGLAVIIFSLLMMGRHPFSGVSVKSSAIDLTEAILGFHYAYGSSAGGSILRPPLNSPPVDMLSPAIIGMFEKAFSRIAAAQYARPTSGQWLAELKGFRDNLLICSRNSAHKFGNARSTCPWCEFEQRSIFFFIAGFSGGGAGNVGTTASKNKARSWSTDKLLYSKFSFLYTRYTVLVASIAANSSVPVATCLSDEVKAAKRAMSSSRICAGFMLFFVIIQWFDLSFSGWMALALVLFWLFEESELNEFKKEKRRRAAAHKAAEDAFSIVSNEFGQFCREIAGIRPFMEGIDRLAKEYNTLEASYEKEKLDLEQQKHQIQENSYLSQFTIDRATIPNFGPTRKATLRSFGIYTAADVVESLICSINGMGDSLVQNLLDWRQSMLRAFKYDPNLPLPQLYMDEMNRRYSARAANLERDIKIKLPQMEAVLKPFEERRAEIEPKYKQSLLLAQQAKADLEALK